MMIALLWKIHKKNSLINSRSDLIRVVLMYNLHKTTIECQEKYSFVGCDLNVQH